MPGVSNLPDQAGVICADLAQVFIYTLSSLDNLALVTLASLGTEFTMIGIEASSSKDGQVQPKVFLLFKVVTGLATLAWTLFVTLVRGTGYCWAIESLSKGYTNIQVEAV